MAGNYVNRYASFVVNNNSVTVPFVKLPEKGTDTFVTYKIGKSRLDKISDDKYGTPYFGWLILVANPEYGGLEWNIPDNALLRVPYPLDASIRDYNTVMKIKLNYYG
jgi:hypothetical protein